MLFVFLFILLIHCYMVEKKFRKCINVAKFHVSFPQLHHAHDSFLALTTDGINFIMNSQEICNVINQCHDPKEAAQRISDQVRWYAVFRFCLAKCTKVCTGTLTHLDLTDEYNLLSNCCCTVYWIL